MQRIPKRKIRYFTQMRWEEDIFLILMSTSVIKTVNNPIYSRNRNTTGKVNLTTCGLLLTIPGDHLGVNNKTIITTLSMIY